MRRIEVFDPQEEANAARELLSDKGNLLFAITWQYSMLEFGHFGTHPKRGTYFLPPSPFIVS